MPNVTKILLILIFLNANVLFAKENKPTFSFENLEFISCYDGDTCTFNIKDKDFPQYLNPMKIRALNIDTPEMKRSSKESKKEKEEKLLLANKAKEITIDFIKNANHFTLTNCFKDSFFRFICEFRDGEKTLDKALLEAGFKEYKKGTKN